MTADAKLQSKAAPNLHSAALTARGRLMFPAEIRQEIFRDNVSEWWVRKNVAPEKKIRLGHSTCAWFEYDVLEWIESRIVSGEAA